MFILYYGYVAFEKSSCKYFINKLSISFEKKKEKKERKTD